MGSPHAEMTPGSLASSATEGGAPGRSLARLRCRRGRLGPTGGRASYRRLLGGSSAVPVQVGISLQMPGGFESVLDGSPIGLDKIHDDHHVCGV